MGVYKIMGGRAQVASPSSVHTTVTGAATQVRSAIKGQYTMNPGPRTKVME